MKRKTLILAVATVLARPGEPAELSVGAVVGAQLLETKSEGVSHGAVVDEVRFGRTWLGGLSLGLRMGTHHEAAVQVVAGPYRNDIDHYCIHTGSDLCSCRIGGGASTKYALLYDAQYSFRMRWGRMSPFIGAGIGAKRYTFRVSPYPYQGSASSLAFHAALGAEAGERLPIRLEARGVMVRKNPYLDQADEFGQSTTQYELQLRLGIRLPLWK